MVRPINVTQRRILGMRIDATNYADAADRILSWAKKNESRSVYAANVHTVMEGHDNPRFLAMINGADLVTPDGMPLVWCLRALGIKNATRVYGPDLTPAVLKAAERERVKVGFYGGTRQVLNLLLARVKADYPDLQIAYAQAPPFRPMSLEEDERVVRSMQDAEVRVLFVGLGCPKQERWIARHRGRIPAVMLGVGAAFDFMAGCKPQAPKWMQSAGLEWAFRFATEPTRLWKRYTKHNPRFVFLVAGQMLRSVPGRKI